MPPRIHPSNDLPLAWSIFSSFTAVSTIGEDALFRAVVRGDFDGTLDGVDENGNCLLGALLRSNTPMHFRSSRWMSGNKGKLPLLCALLEKGSDPWCRDNEGLDTLDRMFHIGIDPLLVDLAPKDPRGPAAWKTRRHVWSGSSMPWLHAIVKHSATVMADLKVLSALPDVDFNQVDAMGNTPLFYASSKEAATFLLERGANPSHRNNQGDGVLAAWASSGIRGTPLTFMKQALVNHGLVSTKEEAISDFHELAKTAPSSVLMQAYRELSLEEQLPLLLKNATHRLLSQSQYNKQEIRTAWGWLDFLATRPGSLEGISEEVAAQLNFLGHGSHTREEDANLATRQRLLGLLQNRRPMSPVAAWESLEKSLVAPSKYSASCLAHFQKRIEEEVVKSGSQEMSGVWYAIELRDEIPEIPLDRASRRDSPLPWLHRSSQMPLDQHPRAWSLLVHHSGMLSIDDFEVAVDHLLAQGTPLPDASVDYPSQLDTERQVLMERAIYLHKTPEASARRPSRRI